MSAEVQVMRRGRELYNATRPFAVESRARSWWQAGSTFPILFSALAVAALAPWWLVRVAASALGALVMVRAFVLYHDYLHGALLRGSKPARVMFSLYGGLLIVPRASWLDSHNYHHAHVGRITGPAIGSFPTLSVERWRDASRGERLLYRISRHPMTILFAYVTVFLANVCLLPFLHNPRRHWGSAVAAGSHFALIALMWYFIGFQATFYGFLLPLWFASALGAYLFYVQHNFEGMRILPEEEWSNDAAALETSSYLKLGPLMSWFTGNIGYHHVHHLNSTIPGYRLPEAMASIPELQRPKITTLHPRDIVASFRQNLWDADEQRMISYREARARLKKARS
jgi:omega-6 fatty acid desaturase (delta-12 desaturase)